MPRLLSACYCLLAATALARASPCQLALNSQLPIEGRSIPARIDDQPVALVLDTGSWTTILTPDAVKRLGLRADPDKSEGFRGTPEDPWSMRGLGGERIGLEVMARHFDLGRNHGRRFHFLTADLGADLGLEGDGLLSTDFLHDYDIDLDFPASEVRLYLALGSCERPKVLLQPPLYPVRMLRDEADRRPRLMVSVDGHDFVALLDTGASHSAIFKPAAAALGVSIANQPADQHFDSRGIGPGKVASVRHAFSAVTVGDLTMRNMKLDVLDETGGDVDVLLGADFQHRVHVWISNSTGMLVMQYPPLPSPPLAGSGQN